MDVFKLKRSSILIFSLILLLYACSQKDDDSRIPISTLEQGVDSLVKKYLDSSKVAGIAIGVYKGGEPLILKSYGFADLEFDVNLSTNATFEIGSVTKQFTSVAILQLVEKGMISLDEDFTKYIGFDTKGRKVTIRNLLTHTSGIKDYSVAPMMKMLRIQAANRDTLLRIMEKEPFDFEPGEALIYSSTGFFILGLIIEKVSGVSYAEFVTTNLFLKAGMDNSYYCSENKVVKNRAHGYELINGTFIRSGNFLRQWPYSAGALCSNVEDLAKWNTALHTGKILSSEFYDEFISPARLNDKTPTRYAMGIAVTNQNGQTIFRHSGGIDGFRSENRYFPKAQISLIALANSDGPVSPRKIADLITNQLVGKTQIKSVRFTGNISKYVGQYKGKGMWGDNLVITINDRDTTLSLQRNGTEPTTLQYTINDAWTDGTSLYYFRNVDDSINELRIDEIYGVYVLKKDSSN